MLLGSRAGLSLSHGTGQHGSLGPSVAASDRRRTAKLGKVSQTKSSRSSRFPRVHSQPTGLPRLLSVGTPHFSPCRVEAVSCTLVQLRERGPACADFVQRSSVLTS